MSWTDERVETLKKLWQEGHSASQIAKQLGGVTRNAVIGKVHRLGLSGRAAPSQPTRPLYKPARPPRPAVSQAQPAASHSAPIARRTDPVISRPVISTPVVPYIEEPGTATVLTLGAKMCKWPIGDPAESTFGFCGRASSNASPYCAEHARVAFQPAKKRERRAREFDYIQRLAG